MIYRDSIKKLAYKFIPFFKIQRDLKVIGVPVSYMDILLRKFHIVGRKYYYYVPSKMWIGMPERLYVGKNTSIGRDYNFFQCSGGIWIGDYVICATRVSLLSSNHDIYNQYISHVAPIKINNYCWLGMNTTILAGVTLGPRTIVAAGAVVTRSFPEGYCILGGVPAKVVKRLDPSKFKESDYQRESEYYGLISQEKFETNIEIILNKKLDKKIFKIDNNKIIFRQ